MYMSQLNLHLKPDFERNLQSFMRMREIKTKSEAIRVAVREGLERAIEERGGGTDFHRWIGAALGEGENPEPRFQSDDDLWT